MDVSELSIPVAIIFIISIETIHYISITSVFQSTLNGHFIDFFMLL